MKMAAAKKSGRKGRHSRAAQSVDTHVGAKLRLRRTLRGMSQTELAKAVGIAFQQIQKYENGSNRISASRLHDFSKALGVGTSYFFEGVENKTASGNRNSTNEADQTEGKSGELAMVLRRETLELIRAYRRVPDAGTRKKIRDLIKSIADNGGRN
jgi:transcriptional regulator with XRE-family HTH domain